jgi:DNA-binding NtrC family response regulator
MEEEAIRCLENYQWPGNVRELENIIERMVILANGPNITIKDIPKSILESTDQYPSADPSIFTLPKEGLSLSSAVELLEKTLILQALDRTGGIKNRASQLLRMNRTTLIEKMKKHKLAAPDIKIAKQNTKKLIQLGFTKK